MSALRSRRFTRRVFAGVLGVIASFISVSAVDWELGADADAMGRQTARVVYWCGARRPCGRSDHWGSIDAPAPNPTFSRCAVTGLHTGPECGMAR